MKHRPGPGILQGFPRGKRQTTFVDNKNRVDFYLTISPANINECKIT